MRVVVATLFIGVSSIVFGQDVILQGQTRREIEKAQRISSRPVIDDTIVQQRVVEYPLLVTQYKTTTEVDRIEPATIKIKDQLDQLYTTYVKVGFGSQLMPLGEVYFNNRRSRRFIYGANAKHLSAWSNVPKYERSTFDRTSINLYGGINEKRYQLMADMHYRNQGLHYYAIRAPKDSLGKENTTQRYNDFGIAANFKSFAKIDTFGINYRVGATYNYFNTNKLPVDSITKWGASENYFSIGGGVDYRLKENIISVDLGVKYNGYKYGKDDSISPIDTMIYRSNTLINLFPSYKLFLLNNRFKASLGVDLTLDLDKKTKFYAYPMAELSYSLFQDMFIPYVGVRGSVKQNTLKALTMENEFLRPNLAMRNENKVIDVYGGFKGTFSKSVSFNIGGGYALVKDMALFVNDTMYSAGNRFNVVYDTAKVFTLEGSISYQLLEKMKVDVIAKYQSFEMRTFAKAWNKPNFELITRFHYNLFSKIYFNFDFKLELGRKALVYAPGDKVKEENLQYYKALDPIYDFNLGVEYRFTKRMSVFLQLNNIAAQRYQRWYQAPVHSFQVLGGLTFRF
ncbi:MAG: hypothetical protein M9916_13650 [Crocinitomicaceae bacterium]|nr:hypothetical protein [Crocinitomicaceae bacterium]